MNTGIPKQQFKNLLREQEKVLYKLKNYKLHKNYHSVVMKGGDKGSTVVFWDREDDIKWLVGLRLIQLEQQKTFLPLF